MKHEESAEILAIACRAARLAGAVLKTAWQQRRSDINERFSHDLKLEQDLQAEKIILDTIRQARPHDSILAEESGEQKQGDGAVWIIDPLDGTVNFSHGMPHFCTSIAWTERGQTQVAVVYDPVRDELFSAVRGQGAFCNGHALQPSGIKQLNEAMVAIGFGKILPEKDFVQQMTRLSAMVQKVRITGAAALDLCWTACGRYDAFCETTLYVWDFAAGSLILSEAGGSYHTWPADVRYKHRFVAGNGHIDRELLQVLDLDPATELHENFVL